MTDARTYFETTYGLTFKRAGRDEWASCCPWCGGDDRFRIWNKGNYFCRPGPGHCGKKGWVDQLTGEKLSPDELRLLKIESAQRRIEEKQAEQERRLTALERLAKNQDHLRYHSYLSAHPQYMDYWLSEGIGLDSIERYKLGYCSSCPTFRDSPSYTIPFVNRGQLVNIRHRLTRPNGSGKYRPHAAGLGSALFNVDLLDDARERVLIVEGEKKSIVMAQTGFYNVGICGKRTFHAEWIKWFDHVGEIMVALDPDAMDSAGRLAAMFGGRARVAALPAKVDDMIMRYGATVPDLESFFAVARPIGGANA